MKPQKPAIRVLRGAALSEQEAEAYLRKEGYQTFKWHDISSSQYPLHSHEHDECIWVLTGEIEFVVDNISYPLRAGDRIYLPANTKHTAKVPASTSVTYLIGEKE